MNRALQLAAAILVAAGAAWGGAWVYSARIATPSSGRGITVPAGEASVPTATDLASPLDPALTAAPQIPEFLPSFTLARSSGEQTSIGAWKGKSLMLNFWATWCAPCRREIPLLEALHREWSGRDFTVIGIAVDHRDSVLAFANQYKIPYPLLVGEQDALDVAGALGVASPAFPFTVFTDRRGQVVALFVGELHRPQADLILSVVSNLNQDRLDLPAARRAILVGLEGLKGNSPG
jgi:peroxiredoxin